MIFMQQLRGGTLEHAASERLSLPEGLGAAELPGVLPAAASEELAASPAGSRYSSHLTLRISSEEWLLCSLVYFWYVTLFACGAVHLDGAACCPGEGGRLAKCLSLLPAWEIQGPERKKSSFPCGTRPAAGLLPHRGLQA